MLPETPYPAPSFCSVDSIKPFVRSCRSRAPRAREEQVMDGISLVIPAYNEAAGIDAAIHEADTALRALGRPYEILVIDDGSSDDTAPVVEKALADHANVRLLRHPHNRGYGAALRTGFEAARHDLVAFTDADCQFHLADLAALVARACHDPIVVGFRMNRQDPWRRRFL